MTLPTIPQKEGVDRNWSPETWRAGLDEAVRLAGLDIRKTWKQFAWIYHEGETAWSSIIAHATTLLDAGIVKPVVSEGEVVWRDAYRAFSKTTVMQGMCETAASAVIDAALVKARMEADIGLIEVLQKIASCESHAVGDVVDIANNALLNLRPRMEGKV